MTIHCEVQPEVRLGWLGKKCACGWGLAVKITQPDGERFVRRAMYRHMKESRRDVDAR